MSENEIPTAEFLVYPNPYNGILSIRLNEMISLPATMSITNLVGQELQKVKLFNTNSNLTIDQPAGIYLIMISDGMNRFSRKIIIGR